jgi:2,3-bisphosphoglycerate-independent phosphoglycerate mutase
VPLLLVDPSGEHDGASLRDGGALCDVGPTILSLLGLPQPSEMTGRALLSGVRA